ncbi:hypothetical protein BpHYR1_035785 [Brachionus plicatilis]|uniref:Uncharacterized protein n=1 Tax=Brachionus plicatilis TaxID=10195 RepID=A0A3M7RF52_BRAPC|nr:hypothetical protein BpHYR1_035785 [Brachionus plicatilis]
MDLSLKKSQVKEFICQDCKTNGALKSFETEWGLKSATNRHIEVEDQFKISFQFKELIFVEFIMKFFISKINSLNRNDILNRSST